MSFRRRGRAFKLGVVLGHLIIAGIAALAVLLVGGPGWAAAITFLLVYLLSDQ